MQSLTDLTVCVVDDDVQVRRLLIEVLASIGLTIDEYRSGEDFIRRWRSGHTGCVLLDVRMPRVTGPEVHDWLREQNPDIPVIFISGYADVPTAVRAMRLGAFDFLEKPFNVQQLIERVHAALRLADDRRRCGTAGRRQCRLAAPADPARTGCSRCHCRRQTQQKHRVRPRHQRAHRRNTPRAHHDQGGRGHGCRAGRHGHWGQAPPRGLACTQTMRTTSTRVPGPCESPSIRHRSCLTHPPSPISATNLRTTTDGRENY